MVYITSYVLKFKYTSRVTTECTDLFYNTYNQEWKTPQTINNAHFTDDVF